jgi:hypothetical protein
MNTETTNTKTTYYAGWGYRTTFHFYLGSNGTSFQAFNDTNTVFSWKTFYTFEAAQEWLINEVEGMITEAGNLQENIRDTFDTETIPDLGTKTVEIIESI